MNFETHNKKDGKAKTCKFCHEHVWWDTINRRWYNHGGTQLHTETCKLRAKHFSDAAMDTQENQRQSRSR